MAENKHKNSEQLSFLKVEGLFGRFDHLIEFNPESDLTIITAPNGYGKTMLIRILDAFFNRRLSFFLKIEFKKINIQFVSGKYIEISNIQAVSNADNKDAAEGDNTESDFENIGGKNYVYIKTHGFGKDEVLFKIEPSASPRALRHIERICPVDKMGQDRWLDYESGTYLTTIEIVDKFGHMVPNSLGSHTQIPLWINEAIDAADTHLIETQRLLSFETEDSARYNNRRDFSKTTSVVDADSDDLSERIGNTITEYANEAQKFDESFPKRIIDVFSEGSRSSDVITVGAEKEIHEQLSLLSKKRDKLVKVGLIGESISEPIQTYNILQEETLSKFLSVYIEDTEKKLSVFDDIYEKIRLFKQIIDEHFSFKFIEFSKEHGIQIKDQDTGLVIPLTELSSGEQHELVLIYELLFKVKNGSLILIDEPELSLHVGWQKRFISDIQKIQRLKHMTFVIATHSPQIINDKWELVQDLAS
jgi:hypothetical protein